jgi:hypothetical protein
MSHWEEKRILILGMTYPHYSNSHVENVCTGGIEEGTFRMVRIHPIPMRYLEPEHHFKAFQWIRARVMKHPSDPRPESLRVDPRSIQVEDVIPYNDYEQRRAILEKSPNVVRSVEELHVRNKLDGTSLGILRPKAIQNPKVLRRTGKERLEWLEKERTLLSQENLFGERMKPLDFPELKFMVPWTCDDPSCDGHDMSLLEWGVHELGRKYRGQPDGEAKIVAAMHKRLDCSTKDVFLFLGNFRTVLYNFGLMGSWSAPARIQGSLFD